MLIISHGKKHLGILSTVDGEFAELLQTLLIEKDPEFSVEIKESDPPKKK